MNQDNQFADFTSSELDQSFSLVQDQRPDITDLIMEVNELITGGVLSDAPRYAISARQEEDGLKMELLFGRIGKNCNLQVLNFTQESFVGVLMGFIHGHRHGAAEVLNPKHAWTKFIHHLNEVDDLDTKSFIGSTDRYKKIFLQANK